MISYHLHSYTSVCHLPNSQVVQTQKCSLSGREMKVPITSESDELDFLCFFLSFLLFFSRFFFFSFFSFLVFLLCLYMKISEKNHYYRTYDAN